MRRSSIIATGLLVLGSLVVAGCGGAEQAASGGTASPAVSESARSAAAPFSGALLDGSAVSLESFKGKPLALIFWASW